MIKEDEEETLNVWEQEPVKRRVIPVGTFEEPISLAPQYAIDAA